MAWFTKMAIYLTDGGNMYTKFLRIISKFILSGNEHCDDSPGPTGHCS